MYNAIPFGLWINVVHNFWLIAFMGHKKREKKEKERYVNICCGRVSYLLGFTDF